MKTEFTTVKKAIVVAAILFAGALVAQANTNVSEETAVQCDGKKELVVVAFENLPAAVQTAIKAECEKQNVEIKEVLQCQESKKFKVVAINEASAEVVLMFEESGKLIENKE